MSMSRSEHPAEVRHATVCERQDHGRAARQHCPRRVLGNYAAWPGRPDPVALLRSQEQSRLTSFLPIRYARMAVSPFTFYRGSAIVMASDLNSMSNTGLDAQLCGDAHLANFGMFAAPDRGVIFDINDFDETNPGPFEWDVLRLSTSFVLAGQDVGLVDSALDAAAEAVATSYRTQITRYAGMSELDVWYDRIDVPAMKAWAREEGLARPDQGVERSAAKARTHDRWSAVSKMTQVVDGHRQFLNDPPLLIRFPVEGAVGQHVQGLVDQYRHTLARERALLLDRYRVIDMAHKVVGVGSVGLRAFVILLEGRDPDDLLVLQAKQAVASVLEPYTRVSEFQNMGERVVTGQRIMQAASDVFLGWIHTVPELDLYVRQLRDMKYSPDPSRFTDKSLVTYATLCGRALARAHARAGDAVAIAAYAGSGSRFDRAVTDFSMRYQEQVRADYTVFCQAIADGRVPVADESVRTDYALIESADGVVEVVDSSPGPDRI